MHLRARVASARGCHTCPLRAWASVSPYRLPVYVTRRIKHLRRVQFPRRALGKCGWRLRRRRAGQSGAPSSSPHSPYVRLRQVCKRGRCRGARGSRSKRRLNARRGDRRRWAAYAAVADLVQKELTWRRERVSVCITYVYCTEYELRKPVLWDCGLQVLEVADLAPADVISTPSRGSTKPTKLN
jgi:hypothetical protein